MQTLALCPYCGEQNTITLDLSAGPAQQYIEDCQICCKPCQLTLTLDGDDIDLQLRAMGE